MYERSSPLGERSSVASSPTTFRSMPGSCIACCWYPRFARRSSTRSPGLHWISDETGWLGSDGSPVGRIVCGYTRPLSVK